MPPSSQYYINGPVNPKYLFLFRVVLFEILLLQVLYSPSAEASRGWLWALLVLYAAVSAFAFWMGRTRKKADSAELWLSLGDVATATLVLVGTRGISSDFYIAYFLVILVSCLLQNVAYSFIVGGVACLVYGVTVLPDLQLPTGPTHLLRLSLLLATAFFSALVADSTRRIQSETAGQYQSRLAWMERLSMVGQMVASLLHELRTPISTILISAEYLKELCRHPDPGAPVEDQLNVIQEESERAVQLLSDFLDFARPSELDLQPLPLRDVVRKVCDRMAIRMEERGIRLEERLQDPVVVQGSERHLIQVFMNLIGNAIEAMPLGGRMTLSQRVLDGEVETRIEDTGVGIAPDALPRLFEPFATSRAESGGHGLGLHIARWIIEKHGGRIQLLSDGLGRGARVSVLLPRRAPES